MFFKYPHTPHLAWLGPGQPRGDKVLLPPDREVFLRDSIVVEEKVDGANVGLSVVDEKVVAQNRGEYLRRPAHEQFSPLWPWIDTHSEALKTALGATLILFGEWCYAVHSVRYDALPDWFLGLDVYDRGEARFWSSERRDRLLREVGISFVARIATGKFRLDQLTDMLLGSRSRYSQAPLEGLYLRRESDDWLDRRAKLVRPEFTQSIQEHWSARAVERNGLRRQP